MRGNIFWGRGTARLMALALSSTALAGGALPVSVSAADWVGAASDDWFDASNWSLTTVPTTGEDVSINSDVFVGYTPHIDGIGGAADVDINTIVIGDSNNSGLGVLNGGTLTSTQATIGNLGGSIGHVVVGGSSGTGPATWTNNGDMIVGAGGTATLDIMNAGVVTNNDATLGRDTGSSGTATVDGTGSTWNNADLIIASAGSGTLTVSNGGRVNDINATLADIAGSSATATVDGALSEWSSMGDLSVGKSGNATLTVSNGGFLNNGTGYIGLYSDGKGEIVVTDSGSHWASGGAVMIGAYGQGTLTIANGGAVNGADTYLGYNTGSVGSAVVDGAGSTWANTAGLTIGEGGTGSLTVSNGATVTDDIGTIGGTSAGTVTVRDAGSTWTNTTTLFVADGGTGTLNILAGGVVASDDSYLGNQPDGKGTVVVDGAGSAWNNTGDIFAGEYGTATVTVSNGGQVTSANTTLADSMGSITTARVDGAGSTWTNTAGFTVGQGGTGSLTISNGGQVFDDGASIGDSASGIGTAIVDGASSTWTNTTYFTVGLSGLGKLQVSNGGALITADANIGFFAGATGTARVDGAGSTWTAGGAIVVGGDGDGSLVVTNGGLVHGGGGYVGGSSTSSGRVNVDGIGSTWMNDSTTIIGGLGDATLTVTNGGLVTDMSGVLGSQAGKTGTARVDGVGSSWTNSSDLLIGDSGTGVLTLSNGGAAAAGAVHLGNLAGSDGTLNIGGAAGGPAAAAGIVNAPLIQFGAGTGTVNFNHTETAYDFASVFEGDGTINQWAGNTNITGTSGTFFGATNVFGGRLAVNGSLVGSVVTVSGGVLGGNGTVGGIVANAGGTVGPGNSIGTLNVNGDVSFAAGSTYQVEVAGTSQSDLIAVTGTATLGGAVKVVAPSGGYILNSHYTILTAAGGITGIFDDASAASGPLPFLLFGLASDPNNIYLDVSRSAATFASVGVTRNQKAAGEGVESLGIGNGIVDAIIQLDTASALDAFDALSGEIHASASGQLLEDDRFVREAALDRLRAAEQGKQGDTGLWMRGLGSWGTFDGDGNAATFDRDIGGFVVGADNEFSSDVTVGLVGGYSRSTFQVGDSRRSSGNSDNYQLGLYGGTQWGNLALRAGTVYTWHELETSRSVDFAGFSDRLEADYSARTAQVFGEFAYRIETGDMPVGALAFEPFANLAYVNLATDSFSENGGAAALTGQDENSGVTFTTLGVRASTQVSAVMSARGTLGWQHAFGDTTPTSDLSFTGGSAFTVAGVPIQRDAAVIEAGVDFTITPSATFGLSYNGQFASDANDQSVHANLNVKF
jgi:outer membrane autotransporter protein